MALYSRRVSASGVAVAVSLLAGVAGSIQVAVSGALGRRVGVLEATAFSAVVGTVLVVAVVLAARQGLGTTVAALREPPWLWIGGVMGSIVVTSITFAPPRIGTFATVGLLIAGQLAMAAAIDYFGLFGLERIGLSAERLAGLALLAAGSVLVLRR